MSPKKMIQAIGDCSRSRQDRMFRLLVMLGLLGLAAGIVSGVIAGENINNLVAMTLAFMVIFCITAFTIRYHKIQLGAVLIAVLIICFVLPFNFLTGGGIYGGGPIWFLFGVVFVCLVVEKKNKICFDCKQFFYKCSLLLYCIFLSGFHCFSYDSCGVCGFFCNLEYCYNYDLWYDFISECHLPIRE